MTAPALSLHRHPQAGRADTIHNLLTLAGYLFAGGEVTTRYIKERFRVSRATAKRYLVCLEASLPVEVLEEDVGTGGCYSPRKVLRLMPEAFAGAPSVRRSSASQGMRPAALHAAPRAAPTR